MKQHDIRVQLDNILSQIDTLNKSYDEAMRLDQIFAVKKKLRTMLKELNAFKVSLGNQLKQQPAFNQ